MNVDISYLSIYTIFKKIYESYEKNSFLKGKSDLAKIFPYPRGGKGYFIIYKKNKIDLFLMENPNHAIKNGGTS